MGVLNSLVRRQLVSTLEVGGGTNLSRGFVLLVKGLILHRMLIDCQTVWISSIHLELGLGWQSQGASS